MQSKNRIQIAHRRLIYVFILAGFLGLPVKQASAALLTLIDQNSTADFDTATPSNNYNWFVNGADILAQQAFWYRVGNGGPEQSVHTLPIGVQGTSDANFDGNPDTLFVRHNGNGFLVEIRYGLDGGTPGSNVSDLTEQISITNLLDSPLDFHFFQYADFDLSAADSVVFTNANAVQQLGGATRLMETVVTPVPSHREAGFFPVTLNKLNDALPTTLIDTPIGTPVGPGDTTWAYQWDFVLQPGLTFEISKDKNLVPEPGAGILLTLASGLFLRRRARRG